jgi:hypothetical protein
LLECTLNERTNQGMLDNLEPFARMYIEREN